MVEGFCWGKERERKRKDEEEEEDFGGQINAVKRQELALIDFCSFFVFFFL